MTSVSLEPFDELITLLRDRGFNSEASAVERMRHSAWTSSSEMLGVLGIEVLRLQARADSLPNEIDFLVRCCITEVRKVWPDIKLPHDNAA